jgi:hypothetical protein
VRLRFCACRFDEQYRYVYYNHMILALRTSLTKNTDLSPSTMDLIDGMHADFEECAPPDSSTILSGSFCSSSADGLCELLVRTNTEKWIVGRRSEQREFYVIFDNSKNANLGDINGAPSPPLSSSPAASVSHAIEHSPTPEEVKKLSSQYFASIFITE